MTAWNMPPPGKIYEALTAVADQRVTITGPTTAQVVSSSRNKTYDVSWSADMREITSNDNGSYWQGYVGYPIIAVLLKLDKLSFDSHIAQLLAGVPWKAVNDHFKRNYDRAIDHVLDQVEAHGGNRTQVAQEVEKIYQQLVVLGPERAQQRLPPPEGRST